jgi:hypothetical protein
MMQDTTGSAAPSGRAERRGTGRTLLLRNTTRTGRILVAFQPARTMEDFFVEGGKLSPLTPAAFADLSAQHGMRVVGPPMA